MEKLAEKFEILPVLSETAANTDTRFGTAQELWQRVETISGKKPITTISGAEPLGPRHMADLMVVCPCTGNTLSKLSNGITDTSVTMAVKSCLRIGLPVVLAVASNDALAASAPNLFRLMNTKNMYLVPLRQDNHGRNAGIVCRCAMHAAGCAATMPHRPGRATACSHEISPAEASPPGRGATGLKPVGFCCGGAGHGARQPYHTKAPARR